MWLLALILITIQGRDEVLDTQIVRRPLYHAEVPESWIPIEPEGSIADTTKPNLTFEIDEKLQLTVYSFPSNSLDERIPPRAQMNRWQRQAGEKGTILPITRGGFSGLRFEAPGVVAWSFQLDPHHYQALTLAAETHEEWEHYKQMRADYTIKVTGPQEKIAAHYTALTHFAETFELIQELPCY